MRFLTLEEFITHHNKLSARLLPYADAPRSNYVRIGRTARDAIDPRNDYGLSAASPDARILFAKAIDRTWDEWAERLPAPFYFITFVSPRFALAEHEAHTFDLAAHHREIMSLLRRHSFIGMTEPAYYPKWRTAPDRDLGPIIAWHSHAISMGSSRGKLDADLAEAAQEGSLLPNASAIHVKAVGRERAKSNLWYSSKMPHQTYAPYPHKNPKERVNARTGEVTLRTHGHSKDEMATGQLARMVNVLNGRYLDELIFGRGTGRKLAEAIKHEARRRIDAEERRERDRRPR